MSGMCVNVNHPDLFSFSDSSKAVAMTTDLLQNLGICVHSAEQHLKTACNIAIPIQKYSMAIY